jgi:predicted enzyme related to lactoylglutathione lyase
MSNPFTYAELHTQDPGVAKVFYSKLFDWKVEDHASPGGEYTEIDPGEGFPGGLLRSRDDGASHWLPYVKVSDLAASTTAAKLLGARALKESVEVPNQGRYSVLLDPTGAPFGMWQPLAW